MIPRSVLLIDDDPLFLTLAEDALRALGVGSIVSAARGQDGLELVASSDPPFDFIFCDLHMPDFDGVDVVRALGAARFAGRLVLVSGEDARVIQSVGRIAEMVGVTLQGSLSKPLQRQALKTLLTGSPNRNGARRETPMTRAELRSALSVGAICPVYQPKLNLECMRVESVEVLARIDCGDGVLRNPSALLKAADTHNMMTRCSLAMLERVIRDMVKWRADGLHLDVAININPSSLSELSLPTEIAGRFAAAGLSADCVTLEITENQLIDFTPDTLDVMSRFRLMGFKLSLDDFGTGATSIEHLRRYPFTELKIDQSFVHGGHLDSLAQEMVESSVRIARMLDLNIVAEGVETASDLRFVRSNGIECVQGYLIARPMSSDALMAWMRRERDGFKVA